jgi:lysophospholipase L1-like esterase
MSPVLLGLVFALAASAQSTYDWGNTALFRNQNLKTPLSPRQERVVFIGDSITANFNLTKFFPNEPYLNRGISGQVTGQMLLRFRQDVIGLKPVSVLIMGGTNDFFYFRADVNAVLDNLKSMAELAHSNGVKVVLCSILPVGKGAASDDPGLTPKIVGLNAGLQAYAKEHGFVYLDYFSALADPEQLLSAGMGADNIHPSDAGYAVMQSLASKAIDLALNRR